MSARATRFFALLSVSFAPCMTTACGDAKVPHQDGAKKPRVQAWEMGGELAARKQLVLKTCRDAGKSDAIAALLLAVIMGESQTCSAKERDMSKDGAGDARNFSAYNMNLFMLKDIGYDTSKAEALNDDAHLDEATRVILLAIDKYGEDKFLCGHRGGQTAMEDGVSYGAREYVAHIRAVQAYLLAHPEDLTSSKRIGDFVAHV